MVINQDLSAYYAGHRQGMTLVLSPGGEEGRTQISERLRKHEKPDTKGQPEISPNIEEKKTGERKKREWESLKNAQKRENKKI